MPTISQLIRKPRKPKKAGGAKAGSASARQNLGVMGGCPQKQGVCIKVYTMTPKKPNSAMRKCARVRLSNAREITAYIPGEGHNLQEHSIVLVKGGGRRDLPGVQHEIIRGAADTQGVQKRKSSRSRYGTAKNAKK